MTKSDSIKNLSAALLVFHKEMGTIAKNDENPFFHSKYAGLSTILTAIKAPLQKAGLTFVQLPTGQDGLSTMLLHPESGEFLEATYGMTPATANPQGRGSALTYQRRYAISALLGLNVDDGSEDDGQAASTPTTTSYKPSGVSQAAPKGAYQCEVCQGSATLKTGTSKTTGKAWKGIFCDTERTHAPKWIKEEFVMPTIQQDQEDDIPIESIPF